MTDAAGTKARLDRRKLRLLSSAVLAGLTVLGTAIMLSFENDGILTARGVHNLKFFTVDSNLLLGLVCLLELILSRAVHLGKLAGIPRWFGTLRYIATVAVALTFTVVVLFFGPMVGYAPLFQDANLFFHLIIPVLAMVSYAILYRDRFIPLRETALALVPALLYGLYYTVLLLVRGVHFPDTDWYGFAAGGVVGSVITAAGVFLTTWVLALLLRLAAGGTKRR